MLLSPAHAQQTPPPAEQAATQTQPHADAPEIRLPPNYRPDYSVIEADLLSSTYIPLDSWMYPAMERLYGLGYLDTAFLGLRPWTRLSALHMLEKAGPAIASDQGTASDEAEEIYLALVHELAPDAVAYGGHGEVDTVYSRFLGITNTPLRDSWNLGQTIINDYGRPYQAGINNSSGASARAEYGRYSLYVRGEYQRAASASGYSSPLAAYLSFIDSIPYASNPVQDTIPLGPISSVNNIRLLEATASMHLIGHEVSIGKTDHWWGPAKGGAFAWSNNADNIYSFQIDRVEPLRVPLLSRVTGPFRYDFLVGSLQGHSDPNHPWVHSEKISFKPTSNLEFGFERTVIWGGRGHEPVNLHTFLRSFFSFSNTNYATKFSNRDPGARFTQFDFSYRLPKLRNWATLYTDSFSHDDVSPVSAPRRAAIRPGIYFSHLPGMPKLDLRVEGASTDPVTSRSFKGEFIDYEAVHQQGVTNKGLIFGDAIGREDKGGQAWVGYHLSPREHIEVSYRRVKAAKDFIQARPFGVHGGTTQDEFKGEIVKRWSDDLEIKGAVQYEQWKAPVYLPGTNSDVAVWGQLTWYPKIARQF
ncbi:MAG TPA: capsule assembly Wzi family protein [Acidobacteriaceae bacterium]